VGREEDCPIDRRSWRSKGRGASDASAEGDEQVIFREKLSGQARELTSGRVCRRAYALFLLERLAPPPQEGGELRSGRQRWRLERLWRSQGVGIRPVPGDERVMLKRKLPCQAPRAVSGHICRRAYALFLSERLALPPGCSTSLSIFFNLNVQI
jgi:hypothetical protein